MISLSLNSIYRLLLITLFSVCSPYLAWSQDETKIAYQSTPGDLGFYSRPLYSNLDLNWGYSFAELVSDLEKKRPNSVESFLKALPEPLLSNYLIMYQSRSLQQASPENPRVILFTPRADVAISFNGHPSQRGYEKIEMMHFDYKTNRFLFREVSFDPKVGYRISSPNPALCLRCHQSPDRKDINPRPNWEPYSIWPGTIGSVDGRLDDRLIDSHSSELRHQQLRSVDREYVQLQAHEAEILNQFINGKDKHPRYSALSQQKLPENRFDNPTLFSELVSNLNARRVVQEVIQHPLYPQIRETFWASIKCDSFPVSQKAFEWLQNHKTFKEIINKSSSELLISEKFHLLFEPLGIDTSDWSLDFKTRGRLAAFERFGTPGRTNDHFLRALNLLEPQHQNFNCQRLKPISETKIDQLIQSRTQEKKSELQITNEQRIQKVIKSCMSCHDGSSDAPEISFHHPETFKNELKMTGFKRGTLLEEIIFRTSDQAPIHETMPANRVLKKEDLDLFINYIQNL